MPKHLLCFVLIFSLMLNLPAAYAADTEIIFEELQNLENLPYDFTTSAVIDGLSENGFGELNNFAFTVQANADVTLKNIILRYNPNGFMVTDHAINVLSGSLTLENVQILLEDNPEEPLEINAVRIGSKGSVTIKNCTIYSGKGNGYALLCEGDALITDDSSIHGTVKVNGNGALLNISGANIQSNHTAIILSKGTASLHSAELLVTDGISPAISLTNGTELTLDRHCKISWPLFNDLSSLDVVIAGIVETISLPTELQMGSGAYQQLTPIFDNNSAFAPVRWSVKDETIASINQYGVISALKVGETVIHAAIPNGETASTQLIITEDNKNLEENPSENIPSSESPQNSELSYVQVIIYAPTYPDLAPPKKEPAALTTFLFYEFLSDTEIYADRGKSEPVAVGLKRDFAIVLSMDDSWAHIIWNNIEGYAPSNSLYEFECTLETMSAQAIFTKQQGIYDRPDGTLIAMIERDSLTLSISTRGEWTALYHDGELVYSPAHGVRLHPITPDYMYADESGSFLSFTPGDPSDIMIYLGPYTPLEIISDAGTFDDAEWVLAKVSDFIGYIPKDHLVSDSPWAQNEPGLSDEERAEILAQSDVYLRED